MKSEERRWRERAIEARAASGERGQGMRAFCERGRAGRRAYWRLALLGCVTAQLACTFGLAPAPDRAQRFGMMPVAALSPTTSPTLPPPTPVRVRTSTEAPAPPTSTVGPTTTPPLIVTDTPVAPTPIGGSGHILYGSGPADGARDLMLLDLVAGEAITLTTGGRNLNPAWSPDGARIAFASDRGGNLDLYVINADGSGLANVSGTPRSEDSPSWSPDGQFLAFASDRTGDFEIYQMRADGTEVVRLTQAPGATDVQPVFAPDGRSIVYASLREGATHLYRLDLMTGAEVALTDGVGQDRFPAFSPDGLRLAFASNRGGAYEIFELDLTTGDVRQLTDSNAQNGSPAYSPDGSQLVFDSNRDGNYDLYRLTLTTRGVTPLTRSDRPLLNGEAAWAPSP